MPKRHEIQVLRRAGHTLKEVVELAGVSQSSVQRVEAEAPVMTLANLRGYIASRGGIVRGAVTLTGRPYSAKLALQPETLAGLRAKHGHEIEEWWRHKSGYGFECLTESEARYLIRAEDAHTIRTKLSAAGFAGHD